MIDSPKYRDYNITWLWALLIPVTIILIHQIALTLYVTITKTTDLGALLPVGVGIRVVNYIIVIYFLFWRRGFKFPSYHKRGLRALNIVGLAIGLSTLVYLILVPVIESIVVVDPELENVFKTLANRPWLYVLLTVFIAPVFEELIFRGLILGGLVNRYGDAFKPLIASSLIFGAFHLNLPQFIISSIIGVFCGLIFLWTGSIRYSIIFHAFYNILISLTTYFLMFLDMSGWIYFIVVILALLFVGLQLYLLYATTRE